MWTTRSPLCKPFGDRGECLGEVTRAARRFGQADRPVLAARAESIAGPGVVISSRWFVPPLEIDRRPVVVGKELADHTPTEPLGVADVVEAPKEDSTHNQASSPIQSVHRWMSHVSRIRP